MECVPRFFAVAQNDRKDAQNDTDDPEKGEYKKGGADPIVSDVAPPQGPAVTYSPTLPGSTIGAGGLNGSVRYG